jgi:hypothetical protein
LRLSVGIFAHTVSRQFIACWEWLNVRDLIRYVPENIVLDLGRQDLGHPEGRAILERHFRQSEQSHPQYTGQNPAFVCLKHDTGTNPGLFLKKPGGEWWAYHYERGSCKSMRVPAPMSDEHKRQVEYWARAGQDAGWIVELECSLPTGTRPDAVIHGPVETGVEVQRYDMAVSAAVRRSTKAMAANVIDLWFTNRTPAPRWTDRVPTVRELSLPWDVTPPRRSATAAGLRKIKAARCTVDNFQHCPAGRGRRCGKHHPREEPWIGPLVDDVAAQAPAGEIVPMRFQYTSRKTAVFLVPPSSLALYEEMTGQNAGLSYSPTIETVPPARPAGHIECENTQPDDPSTIRCYKCGQNAAGTGGILCATCRRAIETSDPYAGVNWSRLATDTPGAGMPS